MQIVTIETGFPLSSESAFTPPILISSAASPNIIKEKVVKLCSGCCQFCAFNHNDNTLILAPLKWELALLNL